MSEFEIFTEDPSSGQAVKAPSKLADDEDKFYYEQSYKEPVEGIKRMEETAKFLVGAVTTASGLFMAASRYPWALRLWSRGTGFCRFYCGW